MNDDDGLYLMGCVKFLILFNRIGRCLLQMMYDHACEQCISGRVAQHMSANN